MNPVAEFGWGFGGLGYKPHPDDRPNLLRRERTVEPLSVLSTQSPAGTRFAWSDLRMKHDHG